MYVRPPELDVKSGDGPRRVGEFLEGVLRQTGVRDQVERQTVLDRWDDVVGERIADVTTAVRVQDAVLFVEVRSSAWAMELDLMKHRILERINEDRDEGRIEKVRFLLAEDG